MNHDARVLIVGAGTYGLSTAYHMARSGYKSVTVLEAGDAIPSPLCAANDLNKIIRAEYEDPFYTDLALEAMAEWSSNPIFAPHYHQVGYLLANSAAAPEKSRRSLAKSFRSIEAHPAWKGKITPVRTRDDIRAAAPALTGPMAGWVGYFNRFAGYAHSADALRSLHAAVLGLGVPVLRGQAVAELLYEEAPGPAPASARRCVGVRTAAGSTHRADVVVLAVGAGLAAVLPRVGRQVTAKAWCVAHVQLGRAQADRLAGLPVTYARDLGFLFEPDPETLQLKVCPFGAGYTNYVAAPGEGRGGQQQQQQQQQQQHLHSLPPADNDFIPARDEERVRRLLRETLPELADEPLVCKHLCWCADSADSDFIFDYVPGAQGLVVASGDSGHGFKFLPIVGRFIMDVVEKGSQPLARWQWKEGSDASGNVSWRTGEVADLSNTGTSRL